MELRRQRKPEVMRYTIVDDRGSVSFVGDSFFLHPLVAACARSPRTLGEMLQAADELDKRIKEYVLSGLAVFDEHNTPENHAAIKHQLLATDGEARPVLRVLDEVTREESLQPTRAGLVIFNLRAQRIVQVKNLYFEVEREGEVHPNNGHRYSRQTIRYALPSSWQIVP